MNSAEVSVRHFIFHLDFITVHKKATFSKIRVAYNNVYRKLLDLCSSNSASEMFVMNKISHFEQELEKNKGVIILLILKLLNLSNIYITQLFKIFHKIENNLFLYYF